MGGGCDRTKWEREVYEHKGSVSSKAHGLTQQILQPRVNTKFAFDTFVLESVWLINSSEKFLGNDF